jgi:GntR family transcriptional regulator
LAAETIASIDRNSHEPAYAQLVRILTSQIASGAFRPGDRLPSEAQLCGRYGVSPMTVRRVVNILVDQGLVVAERGRGTFVKPLELSTATFGLDQLRNLVRGGGQSTVKILEARIVPADEPTARRLAVPPGQRMVYLRRLIFQNEDPVLLHREHVVYDPARPIIESEMDVTALHGLFSGGGDSDLMCGDLTIEATTLTSEESVLLRADSGAPAFRVQHVFYDFGRRPASWGWFICSGARLHFTATIGIANGRTSRP